MHIGVLFTILLALSGCGRTYFPYRGDTRLETNRPVLLAERAIQTSNAAPAAGAPRHNPGRPARTAGDSGYIDQRTVIIVPIPGTSRTEPQSLLERMLEERGIRAIRLQARVDPFQLGRLAQVNTEGELRTELHGIARDVSLILDQTLRAIDAATHDTGDGTRCIGIAGFSMGVTVAALAMQQRERVCVGALVMGGGRPHEILAYSKEPSLSRIRAALLERLGWSAPQLAAAAEPILAHIDPVRHADTIHPAHVLYIDAACGTPDGYVPNSAIEALWRALGQPARYCFHQNHKAAFIGLFLWDTAFRIVDFFDQQL